MGNGWWLVMCQSVKAHHILRIHFGNYATVSCLGRNLTCAAICVCASLLVLNRRECSIIDIVDIGTTTVITLDNSNATASASQTQVYLLHTNLGMWTCHQGGGGTTHHSGNGKVEDGHTIQNSTHVSYKLLEGAYCFHALPRATNIHIHFGR
jgi:hypothetical protein